MQVGDMEEDMLYTPGNSRMAQSLLRNWPSIMISKLKWTKCGTHHLGPLLFVPLALTYQHILSNINLSRSMVATMQYRHQFFWILRRYLNIICLLLFIYYSSVATYSCTQFCWEFAIILEILKSTELSSIKEHSMAQFAQYQIMPWSYVMPLRGELGLNL